MSDNSECLNESKGNSDRVKKNSNSNNCSVFGFGSDC